MSVRRVLGDRVTATYLGGVLVSGFGDSAMLLVAGVWVKTLTGSSSLAAAATFCVWAPSLAGPVLGTVADRVRRRPLLILANAALAVLFPVLLAVRSGRDVWLLFLLLVLNGTGSVLCDAAEAGLVADTVPPGLRGDFNGLRMTVNEAMKLLAPSPARACSCGTAAGPSRSWTRSPSPWPPSPSPRCGYGSVPWPRPRPAGGRRPRRAYARCATTPCCGGSSRPAPSRCCSPASAAPPSTR
jgi:hypothetical protein